MASGPRQGDPGATRSALFVPAPEKAKFDKALSTAADGVILDLEDAVEPPAKAPARECLSELLERSRGGKQVFVRVNSPLTEWGPADLDAVATLACDAVIIPKADAEAVALVADHVDLPLVALVETAAGILDLREIALHPAVVRLMLGPVDLAAELGCASGSSSFQLQHCRAQLVLASAAAGLGGPLDGPCVRLRDELELSREIERAAALGFAGKACIHPAQVELVNAGFSPTEEEIAWARAVARAFDAADASGVVTVAGEMVDLPVVKRAQRILARQVNEEEA